jgi:hypothetical protein
MYQVERLTSRLRKGFLIIGIVLLILSFLFFYVASVTNFDYQSVKQYSITPQELLDMGYSNSYNFTLPDGNVEREEVWEYSMGYAGAVVMHQNDELLVECEYGTNLGSSHIIFFGASEGEVIVAKSGGISANILSFTSLQPYDVIGIYITVPFDGNVTHLSNSLSTSGNASVIVTLDHYSTPNWIYFGVGIVTASLSLIAVFTSRKANHAKG